jgi:hypothetical protein
VVTNVSEDHTAPIFRTEVTQTGNVTGQRPKGEGGESFVGDRNCQSKPGMGEDKTGTRIAMETQCL